MPWQYEDGNLNASLVIVFVLGFEQTCLHQLYHRLINSAVTELAPCDPQSNIQKLSFQELGMFLTRCAQRKNKTIKFKPASCR